MSRLIDADEIEWHDHFDSDGNKKKYKVAYSDEMPPTIEAIPIEFIEKRIAELKKLNEYEFVENGGYTSPSDYEQWGLERLIRDWRGQNDEIH